MDDLKKRGHAPDWIDNEICTHIHVDQVSCWGRGIVADSRWDQEYQQTFDNVGRFLSALETI
jgi:hypothetical protein